MLVLIKGSNPQCTLALYILQGITTTIIPTSCHVPFAGPNLNYKPRSLTLRVNLAYSKPQTQILSWRPVIVSFRKLWYLVRGVIRLRIHFNGSMVGCLSDTPIRAPSEEYTLLKLFYPAGCRRLWPGTLVVHNRLEPP